MNTLSFAIFDDLNQIIHKEWTFNDKDEIKNILYELQKSFLSKKIGDDYYSFFNNDMDNVIQSLYKKNFYVCNRYDKYYVIAFSINYTKFYIWSKDCDAKIIKWSEDGELVNNYNINHDENPVVSLLKNIFNE